MINKEKIRLYLTDTITHKQLILTACLKMLDYLYEKDRYEDAIELAKRCGIHDQSKFQSDEMGFMTQLPIGNKMSSSSFGKLSSNEKDLIKLHWSRNRHHPEYFNDYHDMKDLDVIEMCCDWYARSIQFETSLMEYAYTSNRDRFHFDDEFFAKVLEYCSVLAK